MVITTMAWIMTEQKPKGVRYSENSSQATLWQFKTVIETGDLRYLLVLKNYDELPEFDLTELTVVWQEIYQEFSDIAGGSKADLWMLKTKMLIIMETQFRHHSSLLRVIQVYPHTDLIDLARDEGYMIDKDDFAKTFEKAYTRLMRLKNQISIAQKDQETDDNNDKNLDDLIVTLEKFQGYQFNEKKMSVRKFANIYKKFKDAQTN